MITFIKNKVNERDEKKFAKESQSQLDRLKAEKIRLQKQDLLLERKRVQLHDSKAKCQLKDNTQREWIRSRIALDKEIKAIDDKYFEINSAVSEAKKYRMVKDAAKLANIYSKFTKSTARSLSGEDIQQDLQTAKESSTDINMINDMMHESGSMFSAQSDLEEEKRYENEFKQVEDQAIDAQLCAIPSVPLGDLELQMKRVEDEHRQAAQQLMMKKQLQQQQRPKQRK